jgi:hypothetical protein
VGLLLRGHVREFSLVPLMDYLMECAVVLHKPDKGFDTDLTLERGRLYLSNHKDKGPAVVRLRFEKEIWDVTLEESGTEVGVDLLRTYTRDINWVDGEEPRAELYFCVLQGKASLDINTYRKYSNLEGPSGPALFLWDNKGPGASGPIKLDKTPDIWNKLPRKTDISEPMRIALEELSRRMVGNRPLDVVLMEGLQTETPATRLLAIYSLCALDEVRKLIEILGDEDHTHAPDRDTAIFALRRWISRGPGQGTLLYDEKNKTGILMATQKYRSTDAQVILALLHDFNDVDRKSPETFELLADYMKNKQVAVAELAWYHLRRLAPGVKLPPFNAAIPLELREKASDDVKKLIKDMKLPPPEAAPPGGPPTPARPGPVRNP